MDLTLADLPLPDGGALVEEEPNTPLSEKPTLSISHRSRSRDTSPPPVQVIVGLLAIFALVMVMIRGCSLSPERTVDVVVTGLPPGSPVLATIDATSATRASGFQFQFESVSGEDQMVRALGGTDCEVDQWIGGSVPLVARAQSKSSPLGKPTLCLP